MGEERRALHWDDARCCWILYKQPYPQEIVVNMNLIDATDDKSLPGVGRADPRINNYYLDAGFDGFTFSAHTSRRIS